MSRLMVWVPMCPKPLAEQSLMDAAIDFCQRTEVVRYTIGPINVAASQGTYALPVPQGVRVRRIERAEFAGRTLVMTDTTPNDGLTGTPTYLTSRDASTATLYPAPDTTTAQALTLHVSLEPLRTATEVPDELFADWVETIVAGALYRIASIPDQPFSNPVVAGEAAMRYQYGVSKASSEVSTKRVTSSSRVRSNPLA